ncbi:hypothetical protein [Aliikangiella maris]|uniref:Cupin domain-containing protein n=2 Tax=Aliikangiella maris TaxID=3162458 RepID=A0ABV3MV23_9GAMM
MVKVHGKFVWHSHQDADEVFVVLLVEPKGVINTGDAGGESTAENDIWL